MNEKIYTEVTGQGPALVLIHGWGLNSAVWQQIVPKLSEHFEVYCVDLPGFGHSCHITPSSDLQSWCDAVVASIEKPAIYVGWSLGGLVATQAALTHPEAVTQLITVASSPKFVQGKNWTGIKPDVLALFQSQLKDNFETTLSRFLAIQAMGSTGAKQDIKALHQILKLRPLPQVSALKIGLELLERIDLRDQLEKINQPFLRVYGRLDSLVSHRVIKSVDQLAPQSQRFILAGASHAPFISHREEFVSLLLSFLAPQDLK